MNKSCAEKMQCIEISMWASENSYVALAHNKQDKHRHRHNYVGMGNTQYSHNVIN